MNALVVDDDDTSIVVVENILTQMGYEVLVAHNGREALEVLQEKSVHLVITDWDMPEMSGTELCQEIRKGDFTGYVYIIMITGRNGDQQKLEGLLAGADNFLAKPVKPAELLVCLKTAERILSLETCELAIFALARLAESRDLETGAHIERVQKYARILAEELGKSEKYKGIIDQEYIRLLHQTSPLHDIGKVGIPDAVLLKPGKLNEREFAVMKTHAEIGAKTLDAALERFPNAKFLQMARQIAASHHEKFDGSGYPAGLSAQSIPLCGRIVALADVYDALTSRRVYKPAMSHEQAEAIILRESGHHFDPDVVEAFVGRIRDFLKIHDSLRDSADAPPPALLSNVASLEPTKGDEQSTMLLVEDDPGQREFISTFLTQHGFRVLTASDARSAMDLICKHRPRVVVSDWEMPGMNGTQLCQHVRSLDQIGYIFFLMLTVNTEKQQMIEAFEAGVDDFVVKPFHQGELLARLRSGLRTVRLHDELHRRNQGMHQLNAQLMQLNNKLEKLAATDELTGLYNRRQAFARVEEKVSMSKRYGDALALAILDLDHFKQVNDTHGHQAGDEVLRTVAAILQSQLRDTDAVCRIGGEEFMILFPSETAHEAAVSVERCRAAVESHCFEFNAVKMSVTLSVGISGFRAATGDAAGFLKEADDALYQAKRDGRNCVRMAPSHFDAAKAHASVKTAK